MRDGHCAGNIIRNGLTCCIGQIINRKNKDMVANADATIFPTVS
jgi:hypothetical protein